MSRRSLQSGPRQRQRATGCFAIIASVFSVLLEIGKTILYPFINLCQELFCKTGALFFCFPVFWEHFNMRSAKRPVNKQPCLYFIRVSGKLRAVLAVKFSITIWFEAGSGPSPPPHGLSMSLRHEVVRRNALFSTAVFGWWVLIQDSVASFSDSFIQTWQLWRSCLNAPLRKAWVDYETQRDKSVPLPVLGRHISHIAAKVPLRAFTCISLTRT